MKKVKMIIAVVVSIISAQGVIAQDELVAHNPSEDMNYQYEVQEYTEIDIAELPTSVGDTIIKDYINSQIYKTYISKDNTYKIVLRGKNDFTKAVFTNANGRLLMRDNKS